MAFLVETGTYIQNANSYVTVADFKTFAADRSIAIPTPDTALEALLIAAAEHLSSYDWRGSPVSSEQILSWPRTGATCFGAAQDVLIPERVKQAQMHTALEINTNGSILANIRPSEYKRTKIDILDIEYNTLAERSSSVSLPVVENLLKPLLIPGAGLLSMVRA